MELINYEASWFLSKPGCDAFASLQTLEERSVFLYSYLKQAARVNFEEDQLLFRTAFFLADAVMESDLPYSKYPALVDPEKNPFVAYLLNADTCPGIRTVYYIFLSILHGIADPFKHNAWVYNKQISDPEYLGEKLTELGKCFCEIGIEMPSVEAFAIEESLQTVQLKLIWLLGQREAGR